MKLLAIFVALGLFVFIGGVFAAIEDGIVSVWTFDDGTARDSGGGGNNGIIKGGVKSVAGKFGKAMDFDGAKGSYIEIPDKANLQQDKFTMSAWINVRKGVNHGAIIWKGDKIGWGANFMGRIAVTSDTDLTWGTTFAGTEGYFATAGVIKLNTWYHVCLTADGTTATGYVNATIPKSDQTNPHESKAPLNKFPGKPMEFGVGRGVDGTVGNDFFYNGIIDNVCFWKRALTKDEVTQLSNGLQLTAVNLNGKLSTTWGDIKSY